MEVGSFQMGFQMAKSARRLSWHGESELGQRCGRACAER